jgi:tripartite ATP-independent transporter DctM subunit
MGRITVPEMIRAGYDKGLATGVVASAGTLGIMIPPSIAMILYGIFAEVSIAKLFIAGILPGILTATIYAAMIVIRCMIKPELAPRTALVTNWTERGRAILDAWPLPALVLGIICGLYSGLITATEAGAGGALLAIVIAFIQRRMTWRVLVDSVVEALTNTAKIFFIAFAAVLLSRFLSLSGLPNFLIDSIGSWATDPLLLVLLAVVIYIVLGMFLDPIGLMLLTLPLFLPLFQAAGLDLIWIGVLVVKFIEIGLITPPVGMNVYVINSVTANDVRLETIFRGVVWFLLCEVIVVTLLIAFPSISLFLPGFMD